MACGKSLILLVKFDAVFALADVRVVGGSDGEILPIGVLPAFFQGFFDNKAAGVGIAETKLQTVGRTFAGVAPIGEIFRVGGKIIFGFDIPSFGVQCMPEFHLIGAAQFLGNRFTVKVAVDLQPGIELPACWDAPSQSSGLPVDTLRRIIAAQSGKYQLFFWGE